MYGIKASFFYGGNIVEIIKTKKDFDLEKIEVIGILAPAAEPESVNLWPLNEEAGGFCRAVLMDAHFKAKAGSSVNIPVSRGVLKNVIIYGLGDTKETFHEKIREGSFNVLRTAAAKGFSSILLAMPDAASASVSRAASEGALLGCYRFNKYLSPEEDDLFSVPGSLYIPDADEDGIRQGIVLAEAQCYARDIANEPGNIVTPAVLAQEAMSLAEKYGLECEIWEEDKIEKEGMSAFYAVGKGSANPPRFIRLTYEPTKRQDGHIVLVGKGMTFDSGGLDIKPADYMTTMKGDKSGACAVLGTIRAAAELKLPWKITVLIAAAENMPGGNAYRPDDILRARNGKTIEVNNTDAEGRLTLADALSFASELKPDMIIDIATLTGACAVALGGNTGGLFTNDAPFGDKVLSASQASGERFWKLPMDDPTLSKAIKSPVADLVNSAGRYGGAITAAMFLEAFVSKEIPWVHLDIAAADFIKEQRSYYTKGASGFGTRTLITLLMSL